MNDQTKHI
jgi:hypothetical protein